MIGPCHRLVQLATGIFQDQLWRSPGQEMRLRNVSGLSKATTDPTHDIWGWDDQFFLRLHSLGNPKCSKQHCLAACSDKEVPQTAAPSSGLKSSERLRPWSHALPWLPCIGLRLSVNIGDTWPLATLPGASTCRSQCGAQLQRSCFAASVRCDAQAHRSSRSRSGRICSTIVA